MPNTWEIAFLKFFFSYK